MSDEIERNVSNLGRRGVRRVRSEVKEMIGALIRDEELQREGELRHQQVDLQDKAQDEAQQAELRGREAGVRIRQAQLAADRARLTADAHAEVDRVRVDRGFARQADEIDRDLARKAAEGAVREHLLHDAVRRAEDEAAQERRQQRLAAARHGTSCRRGPSPGPRHRPAPRPGLTRAQEYAEVPERHIPQHRNASTATPAPQRQHRNKENALEGAIMNVTTLTRGVVRFTLHSFRLPLNVAEAVFRRTGADIEDWYPSRAFEGVEGDAKRVIGALLRDSVLIEEGYRHRARVDELRHARRLHLQAEGLRLAADERYEERHRTAVKQHQAVDAAAQELERQRAAEGERRHSSARQAAQQQRGVVEHDAQEAQAIAHAAERAAQSVRVAEESAVLEHAERAARADRGARSVGRAAERQHAERRGA